MVGVPMTGVHKGVTTGAGFGKLYCVTGNPLAELNGFAE